MLLRFVFRLALGALVGVVLPAQFAGAQNQPPALLLAETYEPEAERALGDYWVSEKLDGVRARWDGARFVSRGGNVFAAPAWFSAGFPAETLDGELWLGRARFEQTVSIVRRAKPHAGWRALRFMVFDLPSAPGDFNARVTRMRALARSVQNPHFGVVEQFRVQSHAALVTKLDAVTKAGGEGLMLHHGGARYESGRSRDLLKFKRFEDAEAVVVAHHPGRGRLRGLTGAIGVELPNGQRFRIGSGFSDAERRAPPPIGSTVTFRHQGKTANGVPRFPVFWRVRHPE